MRLASDVGGEAGARQGGVERLEGRRCLCPTFGDAQGVPRERLSELLGEASMRRFGAHQIVAEFRADFLHCLCCCFYMGEDRLGTGVEDETAEGFGHLERREVGPTANQYRYQMGVWVGDLETGGFVEQLKNL